MPQMGLQGSTMAVESKISMEEASGGEEPGNSTTMDPLKSRLENSDTIGGNGPSSPAQDTTSGVRNEVEATLPKSNGSSPAGTPAEGQEHEQQLTKVVEDAKLDGQNIYQDATDLANHEHGSAVMPYNGQQSRNRSSRGSTGPSPNPHLALMHSSSETAGNIPVHSTSGHISFGNNQEIARQSTVYMQPPLADQNYNFIDKGDENKNMNQQRFTAVLGAVEAPAYNDFHQINQDNHASPDHRARQAPNTDGSRSSEGSNTTEKTKEQTAQRNVFNRPVIGESAAFAIENTHLQAKSQASLSPVVASEGPGGLFGDRTNARNDAVPATTGTHDSQPQPVTRQAQSRQSHDPHSQNNQSITVFAANKHATNNNPVSLCDNPNPVPNEDLNRTTSRESNHKSWHKNGAASALDHPNYENVSASSHSHYKIVNLGENTRSHQGSRRGVDGTKESVMGQSQAAGAQGRTTRNREADVTTYSMEQTLEDGQDGHSSMFVQGQEKLKRGWNHQEFNASRNFHIQILDQDESSRTDSKLLPPTPPTPPPGDHLHLVMDTDGSNNNLALTQGTLNLQVMSRNDASKQHKSGLVPGAKEDQHGNASAIFGKQSLNLNLSAISPNMLADSLDEGDSVAFMQKSLENLPGYLQPRHTSHKHVSVLTKGTAAIANLLDGNKLRMRTSETSMKEANDEVDGKARVKIHETAQLASSLKDRQIFGKQGQKADLRRPRSGSGMHADSDQNLITELITEEAIMIKDEEEDEANIEASDGNSERSLQAVRIGDNPTILQKARVDHQLQETAEQKSKKVPERIPEYGHHDLAGSPSEHRSRFKLQKSNSVDLFGKKNVRPIIQQIQQSNKALLGKDKLRIQSTHMLPFKNQAAMHNASNSQSQSRVSDSKPQNQARQRQRHKSVGTIGKWNLLSSKMKNSVFAKKNKREDEKYNKTTNLKEGGSQFQWQGVNGIGADRHNGKVSTGFRPPDDSEPQVTILSGQEGERKNTQTDEQNRSPDISSYRLQSALYPDQQSLIQSTDSVNPHQNLESNLMNRTLHHSLNYLLQPVEKFQTIREKVQQQLDPMLKELIGNLVAQLSSQMNNSIHLGSLQGFFERLNLLQPEQGFEEQNFLDEELAHQIQMNKMFMCSNVQTLLFPEGDQWVDAELLQAFMEGLLWQGDRSNAARRSTANGLGQDGFNDHDREQEEGKQGLFARANCGAPACSSVERDVDGVLGVRLANGQEIQQRFRMVNEDEQCASDKRLYLMWLVQQAKRSKKDYSSKIDLLDQEKFIILELEAELVNSICWMLDRIIQHQPLDPESMLMNNSNLVDLQRSAQALNDAYKDGLHSPMSIGGYNPLPSVAAPDWGIRPSGPGDNSNQKKQTVSSILDSSWYNAQYNGLNRQSCDGDDLGDDRSVSSVNLMGKKINEFRRIFDEYQSIRSFYQKKNKVSADQAEFELQQSILLDLTDVIEDHMLRQVQTQRDSGSPEKVNQTTEIGANGPDGNFQSLMNPKSLDMMVPKMVNSSVENLDMTQLEIPERRVLQMIDVEPAESVQQLNETMDHQEEQNLISSPQRKSDDLDISVYISLTSQQKIKSSHIRSIHGMTSSGNHRRGSAEQESAKPTVCAIRAGNIKDNQQLVVQSQTEESPHAARRVNQNLTQSIPASSSHDGTDYAGTAKKFNQTQKIELFVNKRDSEDMKKSHGSSKEGRKKKLSARTRNKVFESTAHSKTQINILPSNYLNKSKDLPPSPPRRAPKLCELNSSIDSKNDLKGGFKPDFTRDLKNRRFSPAPKKHNRTLDSSFDVNTTQLSQKQPRAINQTAIQEEKNNQGSKQDRKKSALNNSQKLQTPIQPGMKTISIFLGSVNSKKQIMQPDSQAVSQIHESTSQMSIGTASQHGNNRTIDQINLDAPVSPTPVPTIGAVSSVASGSKQKKRNAKNLMITSTHSFKSQYSRTSSNGPNRKRENNAAVKQTANNKLKEQTMPTVPGVLIQIETSKKKPPSRVLSKNNLNDSAATPQVSDMVSAEVTGQAGQLKN